MDRDSDQIQVSRSALRAELAQLELRLVDRLTDALERKADHVVVEQLEVRVSQLELSRAERSHIPNDISQIQTRVGKLERFRYAVPGVGVVSLFMAVGIAVYDRL